jgi:hypothetical protein
LQVSSASTGIQASVCAAPGNNPCQTFNAFVVPLSSLQLQTVAGVLQIVPSGRSFQPVMMRVIDGATTPDPVLGASVLFQSYVGRVPQNEPIIWLGEAGISQPAMPVILAAPQATMVTDVNGLASFAISSAGISGDVAIVGSATIGNSSMSFEGQQLGP